MLRVASLLCLLPALALAAPPLPAQAPRVHDAELPMLAPGALRLQLPERREWSQQAYSQQSGQDVRKGVLAGVVVGGLFGVATGVLLCNAAETSDGSRGPFPPACGLFGGLIGAALGAGIGALIDSAAGAEQGQWVGGPARRRGAGDSVELGVQLGWAWRADARLAGHTLLHGPGADLRLLARLGPYVALGPELAVYRLLTQEFTHPVTGLSTRTGGTLSLLGMQVRAGAARGQLRPELVLGFGRVLGDAAFNAGSVGAALSYAVSPRVLPQLEVRYHHSFGQGADYVTLGAGAALRW
jgi:hypothetical protein